LRKKIKKKKKSENKFRKFEKMKTMQIKREDVGNVERLGYFRFECPGKTKNEE